MLEVIEDKFFFLCHFFVKNNIYLFIWLYQVLVGHTGSFVAWTF